MSSDKIMICGNGSGEESIFKRLFIQSHGFGSVTMRITDQLARVYTGKEIAPFTAVDVGREDVTMSGIYAVEPMSKKLTLLDVQQIVEVGRKVQSSFDTTIQRRAHRKKRINKKWRKRYGMLTIGELADRYRRRINKLMELDLEKIWYNSLWPKPWEERLTKEARDCGIGRVVRANIT